ncbi:uncharacterized protein DSM5745_09312 [Aspergillus mulundensis]|uniref:Uncharacterized protein n=1 Tax=Aspergillus mulundensis TaxID=1810919 RepID=A0A3D8R079_9EURO|nr:hypothetical protein DSM5745_09312 [Aspergillus mulundensis]RDW67446.1 hypothetical protein DSM5745_09312 [Aspergillus mulundensis]
MDSQFSHLFEWPPPPPPTKYGPDTRPPEGHQLAIPFLYSPLPDELPTGVHKDLLLLYAAYVGNINRYVRLRDPNRFIKYEFDCVIRGIYHDTMFAKDRRALPPVSDLVPALCFPRDVRRTRPSKARNEAQAARACIVADYKDAYKRLNPTPDWFLLEQAYYPEDLQRRAEQMCIDISEESHMDDRRKVIEDRFLTHWRAFILPAQAVPDHTVDESELSYNYNGFGVDLSALELYVSSSDDIKKQSHEMRKKEMR